ncbi:TPA: bacteriophage abortive infection AbiH family protein, partial [Listeria innocua]
MSSINKLFIIGNGFDLAHGVPSTFNHFKEYLRCTYLYEHDVYPSLWLPASTDYDGEICYKIEDCAQIIDFMICDSCLRIGSEDEGENWSDFERAIGRFDYSLLEEDIEIQYDKEGDINPFHTGNNYEDAYNDLSNVMLKLPELFSEWINNIPILENCFSVFNLDNYYSILELIDKEHDVFLTFNYTETLENLYEAENVTHIHGNQTSPVLGHNNTSRIEEQSYHQDTYINTMNETLKKPTDRIIEEKSYFFKNLEGEIDSIYSYGFSFGEVDLIYLK